MNDGSGYFNVKVGVTCMDVCEGCCGGLEAAKLTAEEPEVDVARLSTKRYRLLIRRCLTTQDQTKDDTTHNNKEPEDTREPYQTRLSVRAIAHLVKPRAEEEDSGNELRGVINK